MRKVSYFDFLKRFLVINLILIGVYFVVTLILNMFFGEAMKILQTTPVYSGEGNTFLLVFMILFQLCIGAGYFVLSYLDARRDAIERREFLTFIGTEKFDTGAFYKMYFANKGKSLMIYFSVTVGAIALLSLIGVPFITILIIPQHMFIGTMIRMTGLAGTAYSVLLYLISSAVNIAAYYVYQRIICMKIYEKWESERLRRE